MTSLLKTGIFFLALMGRILAQSSGPCGEELVVGSDDYDPVRFNPHGAVLYSNGPPFNASGTGSGGADLSILFNETLGTTTLGYAQQAGLGHRVADDFTIPDNHWWRLETATFFSYETGATRESTTVTGVNLRIWQGCPGEGGRIVWMSSGNILWESAWSGIYRVTESKPEQATRPIMASTVIIDHWLGPGYYWLDWQTRGSDDLTGPWAPPIPADGPKAVTGNGLQFFNPDTFPEGGGAYIPAVDQSGDAQGFPFILTGERLVSPPPNCLDLRPDDAKK